MSLKDSGQAGSTGSQQAALARNSYPDHPSVLHSKQLTVSITLQGGVIEVGAPTGKWQLIVVYRGKHCPVSRNYLASLQQIIYELDDLGVEVLALTADGREKAEAFVSIHTCIAHVLRHSLQYCTRVSPFPHRTVQMAHTVCL